MEVVNDQETKVSTKENVVTKDQVQEPTYDQLKMYVDQLMSDRQKLIQHINKLTKDLDVLGGVLQKLPYLFKVLKYRDSFPEGFVQACVKEIVLIMSSAEVQQNTEKKEAAPTQEEGEATGEAKK